MIVYNDCLDENRIRRRLDDLTERIFGEGTEEVSRDYTRLAGVTKVA